MEAKMGSRLADLSLGRGPFGVRKVPELGAEYGLEASSSPELVLTKVIQVHFELQS